MEQGRPRRHSHEFRVEIAQRMLNGECVKALSEQYGLPRSMMYRWREAYRKSGPEGLQRPMGRPPGSAPSKWVGCAQKPARKVRNGACEPPPNQELVWGWLATIVGSSEV